MQRSWSSDDRRQALALADRCGLAQASVETGIPEGTIKSWRHRLTRAAIAATEIVQPLTGRTWDERRDRVVIDFADTLDLARAQLHAALKSGTTKAARDLVIVVGVLAEKCELFSGGATSRHESYSLRGEVDLDAMRREIAENEAKLAALETGEEGGPHRISVQLKGGPRDPLDYEIGGIAIRRCTATHAMLRAIRVTGGAPSNFGST